MTIAISIHNPSISPSNSYESINTNQEKTDDWNHNRYYNNNNIINIQQKSPSVIHSLLPSNTSNQYRYHIHSGIIYIWYTINGISVSYTFSILSTEMSIIYILKCL